MLHTRRLSPRLLLLALAALLVHGCGDGPPEQSAPMAPLPETVDYNYHVKPILSDRCFACHGPDEPARKSGLRLDTEEGALARLESGKKAVVPGKPGRSEMIRRITTRDPEVMMPPPESHLTLSAYEIALLTRWVEQGAEHKPHWSFIPPEKPALPAVAGGWARNEIDRFVLAKMQERGLQPNPEASKETLIRRVSFDLTGLPPAPQEIDAFLSDTSPDAYEKLIDRLFQSPAYGERMATEWLDIARYADSHGYQDDGMRNMWPWRDWAISAFNRNLPFDDFITWQLAGDLLPNRTREQLLATAFNRNHSQSQEGGIVPEEYRVEYVSDRVTTLGRAFLGMGIDCARCHDHKYDPILQKEFFQLYSFFNSVNEAGQIPYSGEPSPTIILTDSVSDAKLAAIRAKLAALEAEAAPTHPAYDAGYEAWVATLRSAPAAVKPAGPIAHLPLDGVDGNKTQNVADARRPAQLKGDPDRRPETVEGRIGKAQRLVGDSFFDFNDGFAFFERNEPFSMALWMRIEQDSVKGPVFTKSGGYFNGNRGYEMILRRDRTFTAALHHVFPDNSIEIETLAPISKGAWHHLVFTYDGSSRAKGLRLYADGKLLPARITADNLKRSILHRGDGSNHGYPGFLRIGNRYDESLQDVAVDEFMVFDRQLTHVEVAALGGDTGVLARLAALPEDRRTKRQSEALREHYVLRADKTYPARLRQLTALRGEENEVLTSLPEVMVMKDRFRPRPTFVLDRGAYDAPTVRVEPGTPAVLGAFPADLPKNRLGLAQWLLSDENPLAARVLVNRYWQLFFGRGIVATVDDFGNQGELPTHPELLDYLAVDFRESGWDLRRLQKKILLSATYRQSSVADEAARAADPDNRWLARGPSHRLPAEMIRDNALAASGLLVRQVGGPSVYPYQPPGLWEELATRNATTYVQEHGDNLYRRSLYTIWKRSSPPPSMISFDAAERYFCTVKRQTTSTPLQSLILMNDPQYVEAARLLAERAIREGGATPEERITHAFRLLTSRRPTRGELAILNQLYADEYARFTQERPAALQLLSTGEYPRNPQLAPAETAALSVVASTIMNFDEAVVKR